MLCGDSFLPQPSFKRVQAKMFRILTLPPILHKLPKDKNKLIWNGYKDAKNECVLWIYEVLVKRLNILLWKRNIIKGQIFMNISLSMTNLLQQGWKPWVAIWRRKKLKEHIDSKQTMAECNRQEKAAIYEAVSGLFVTTFFYQLILKYLGVSLNQNLNHINLIKATSTKQMLIMRFQS